MASKESDDQKLADQANELYWRSGQSVNQIAERMDLSKSGLYALISPLPAERGCPDCGEGMVFLNRTTEQKAVASCPECEYDEASGSGSKAHKPTKRVVRRSTAVTKTDAEPVVADGHGWMSSRVLWGSVLLGVAAGLYMARRSR